MIYKQTSGFPDTGEIYLITFLGGGYLEGSLTCGHARHI